MQRAALEACHKGWGVSTIIGVAGAGKGKLAILLESEYCIIIFFFNFRNLNTSVPASDWACVEGYGIRRLEEQGQRPRVGGEVPLGQNKG